MAQQRFLTPDRLNDRPFSAGHPFRRSHSKGRRWGMLALFLFLCALIGGYLVVTNADRVKAMAESELSRLVGAPVTVGKANLSIFEGLRLESVNVYVDQNEQPDSLLFSAKQLLVSYDPKRLLAGRLRLTRIIAIDPYVQLIENLNTEPGVWNYQRIPKRVPTTTTARSRSNAVPTLPEIILRNAQIDYSETRGGRQTSRGSMMLEGQFAPSSDGERYSFELQSRGGGQTTGTSVGPTVTGTLVRGSGAVTARLQRFQFGQDIRSMLPAQVRQWWDRHQLTGSVDVPVLSFTPARGPGGESKFVVQTRLLDVNLTVDPEEWMSRDELRAQSWAEGAFDGLRAAGLDSRGVVTLLEGLVKPRPVKLQHVTGTFQFTETGIELAEVTGALEGNGFEINGRIDGYSPQAPVHSRLVATAIRIPATPKYLTSMPRAVRELYDHLRPQGTCSVRVQLDRAAPGERIEVAGEVDILDGNFVFDRFPYPVRAATGKIIFGYDPLTGTDSVRLVDLRGKGSAGGPNAESVIRIDGTIAPLNGDAGVFITVKCDSVHDEPLLMDSFPPEVREALENMDADGRGEYPKYHGAFECRVNRQVGPRSPWIIDTDVTLLNASGKMVPFPYLMENVTGKLAIREGYVDIVNATMKRAGASLSIDGRVAWRAGMDGKPLQPGETVGKVIKPRPDLKITARNVPIDQSLLDALPPDRREWLQKAGLSGKLDIDGRVWRPGPGEGGVARSDSASELTHAFDLALRDGTIWPVESAFAISGLSAKLHLLPDRMSITDLHAKRGGADLTGRGEVSWPANRPSIFFSGTASKLELDRTLYRVLPPVAQAAWDAVKPEGVVDLDVTYRGAVSAERKRLVAGGGEGEGEGASEDLNGSVTAGAAPGARSAVARAGSLAPSRPGAPRAATAPAVPDIDLIIHPVNLSATVQAVPYRLDDIQGTVRVTGNKVSLTDLTASHGDGRIRVSGSGTVARESEWDLRVSAEDITVDEEFRHALPGGLATVVEGLKLAGVVGFDFPKLTIKTLDPAAAATRPAAVAAAPAPSPTTLASTAPVAPAAPVDVDFEVKLAMDGASLDVGLPMSEMTGTLELAGNVRNSKLASLSGPLVIPSLSIADRAAEDFRAEFYKPADQDALRVGKITGRFAGGSLDGTVDLAFPDAGPSRYAMNLVLRNADVRDLTGETGADFNGQLSASLALEGDWTNPASRRGRGDVAVRGKEMYKIPLVLGLLQITNLSLPITSPFSDGSARYMVEGPVVTFESLELRSRDMLMSGSGKLDFDTKKVRMTFTTDNPNWPKLPIIGDIMETAKHELLQIHVKGTLQEPKVSATAVNTVTTTVDEVLRGDAKR